MAGAKTPATPAIRALRAAGVDFEARCYDYVERGGTRHSAASLGVAEHEVVKTLVMEDETDAPLVVLMHGDFEVSTRELARTIGVRTIRPCTPACAQRHTGYRVGGTSPFGTRRPLPIYMEASIADLERVWINGGRRGLLVGLSPRVLDSLLSPTRVRVATGRGT